jgi:PTH2 family peptidyl-tRNA hydrolase
MVSVSNQDEIKQVIVVRSDLNMGKGKMCAQVGHACIDAYLKASLKDKKVCDAWIHQGMQKVVLKILSEKELVNIFQMAKQQDLPSSLIIDAGRTQIEPGSKTCVGIGPAYAKEIDKITANLSLM